MLHLITNYYSCGDDERQTELDACLLKNCLNKQIDKVHALTIGPQLEAEGVVWHHVAKRPTFNDFFAYANRLEGVAIISNLDIIYNDTIKFVKKLKRDICIALSRRDDGKIAGHDSQDSWMFRLPIKKIDCDFFMGQKGCDNVLAILLAQKYKMRNPAKKILAKHIHRTGYRTNQKLPIVPGRRGWVGIT